MVLSVKRGRSIRFTCVRCGAMVLVLEAPSTLKGCLKWGPQAHPQHGLLWTATIEGNAGPSPSAWRGFPQGGQPSLPPGVCTPCRSPPPSPPPPRNPPTPTLLPLLRGQGWGWDVRDILGDGAGQGIGSFSFGQRCLGIFLSRPGHRAGIWEADHEWGSAQLGRPPLVHNSFEA